MAVARRRKLLPPVNLLIRSAVAALVLGTTAYALEEEDSSALPDFADSAGAIISPEQERELGEAFMRELRRSAPLVTDEEVEDYIRKLGTSLGSLSDYPGEISFVVIDSPVINAFAVPGGFIGVHTGLILNSHNESEVASVLAHEISHLTQRHGARMIEAASQLSIPSMAAMMGAMVLAAISPQAGMAALVGVQAASQQYQINFTRANEQEADRIGIQLLYDAGYDTKAMAAFFERMQLANRYSDPKYIPEFLRTHPVTVNRIAEARTRAEELTPTQIRESSYDYYLTWAKLNVLSAGDPTKAKLFYETALRDRDYVYEAVARYGYVLALTDTNDYAKARAEIRKLLAESPKTLAFQLAAARVEQEAGNYARAAEIYYTAMQLDPESRAGIYGYANALTLSGNPARAKKTLRDYGFSDHRDPRFFRLLAEAEEHLGERANSQYSLSAYYQSIGELELAQQSLKVAEIAPDLTNYQRTRIDARMAEIEKELDALYKDKRRNRRRDEP